MGEFVKEGNRYRSFAPDDTNATLHLSAEVYRTLQEIIEAAQAKWGDIPFEDILIDAQHIQTDCLGSRYDSGDYTNYIVVTNKKMV